MNQKSIDMAKLVIEALEDKKAEDIRIIDISEVSVIADYFIIASGGSERQMSALVDNVEDMLEPMGVFPKSIEGKRTSGWTLMDYGDVVINVMTVDMRQKYNLERIWGDCETLEINM